MKRAFVEKITFIIFIAVSITLILYPKLTSSTDSSSLNDDQATADLRSRREAREQARGRIQELIQRQNQVVSKGDTQLDAAVKSGKPTMILFHSDG